MPEIPQKQRSTLEKASSETQDAFHAILNTLRYEDRPWEKEKYGLARFKQLLD